MWNEFDNDKYKIRTNLMKFIGYELGYWPCIGIFIALIFGFRVIAYICFRLLVSKF
jgi:hypothetical protein